MNCLSMREEISLYVSDDLSTQDIPALEAHLKSCAACAHYHDEMSEMVSHVQRLKVEVPLGSLARTQVHVLEAMEVSQRNKPWPWKGRAFNNATMGIVMMGLMLVGLWTTHTLDSPSSETTHLIKAEEIIPVPTITEQATLEQEIEEEIILAVNTQEKFPPLFVKLYTENPDIVIYWFGD